MSKTNCSACNLQVNTFSMCNHISKVHSDHQLIDQIMIHQLSALEDSYIKLKYLQKEFVKEFISTFSISSLKEYSKTIGDYAKKFNSYCDMICKMRNPSVDDIDVFFNDYLPHKQAHPKDVNSRRLAEIACKNHPEDTDKFYEEVLMKRNAYAGHGGELSPWSKDFKAYSGMTDKEKTTAIRQKTFCKDRDDYDELKKNHNCNLEYYLNLGMSEEDAKTALKARQSTFSLEKCIEKYGEEAGRERFAERQRKWLNSLDTPENIEKMKAGQLKGFKATMGKGYSEISQKLFNEIRNRLPNLEMLYATNGGEYIVDCSPVKHPMLDFYIPSKKCWIEFDGDYWHGEKRGNQERDRKREEAIKKSIPDIKLLRIRERDYKNTPDSIITECISWINSL